MASPVIDEVLCPFSCTAQLDASRRTSLERRESAQTAGAHHPCVAYIAHLHFLTACHFTLTERQHGGPRGNVRQKDSTPLQNSTQVYMRIHWLHS